MLDAIRAGLNNLIITAEELKAKSIAIPLIGSGSLGFPTILMADVILGTLHHTLVEVPTNHLQKIKLVTLDDGVLKALKARIDGLDWSFADKNSLQQKQTGKSF